MRLITFAPAVAITLVSFLVAWQFVNPAPPRTITIATGERDSAFFLFAGRYRELLAAEGIELQIRHIATWTLVSGLVATFSRNRMATYQRKLSVRWSPA